MATQNLYGTVTTLTLESTPENVAMVEPYVDEVKQKYGFGEEIYGNILISLSEAVNNAIIHGNSSIQSKKVTVICEPLPDQKMISFKIIDEGTGFDYTNIPDPTAPENLHKITGRGVFLMKQLADWVIFSDDGSIVEIQFKI